MRLNNRRSVALAALTVASLVAVAACGDDDDSAGSGTVAEGTTATTATTRSTGHDDRPSPRPRRPRRPAGPRTRPHRRRREAARPPAAATTAACRRRPSASCRRARSTSTRTRASRSRAARSRFGIEADTANGWAPYKTSFATAGYVLLASVSDPLFGATEDGEIAGVLIDKWEPNADYTEWTLHVRDGIKFQDGTPLDGAAVAFNINTCKYSALTGAAYTPLESVTGVRPGRHHQVGRRPVGRPAPRLHRAPVRLHDVAGVAEDAARHHPARPEVAGLRRRAGRHAGQR